MTALPSWSCAGQVASRPALVYKFALQALLQFEYKPILLHVGLCQTAISSQRHTTNHAYAAASVLLYIDCLHCYCAGYAGDVWNPQPPPEDHPWRTMPNHGMTPHYSGTTLDAQVQPCLTAAALWHSDHIALTAVATCHESRGLSATIDQ